TPTGNVTDRRFDTTSRSEAIPLILASISVFLSLQLIAKGPKRFAQIVLGRGPILRQIGLGIDLEGGAISGNRVLEQLAPFFCAAARPELCKRVAQTVLSPGPILRQIGLGIDLKGGAISGHRLLEQFAPFFS